MAFPGLRWLRVRILVAVPCDERGNIDRAMQAKYEDFAEGELLKLRPDAEIA